MQESTLNAWKLKHPIFKEALERGRAGADQAVANALYRRAIGYTEQDVKIFCSEGCPVVVPYTRIVDPDVTAQIFWLKNRHPDQWRDRHNHEHTGAGGGPIQTREFSVAAIQAELISRGELPEALAFNLAGEPVPMKTTTKKKT